MLEKKYLDNKDIDEFYSWFLREYSLCMVEPQFVDVITSACCNQRLGGMIQNFGYDFIKPFLDGSLQLDKVELEKFEKSCPLSYKELETLNGLLYGHLAMCDYCRHVNSVHVTNQLSGEFMKK